MVGLVLSDTFLLTASWEDRDENRSASGSSTDSIYGTNKCIIA
ncbi:MAG: hypothetical protein ACJZ2B_06305 [Candidatus Neomarinimicrobiota bacterium]